MDIKSKEPEDKVKCLGYMDSGTGKHQSDCVYSTCQGIRKLSGKSSNYTSIIFLGNMRGQNQGFVGSVYSPYGISGALRARDYKESILIQK